METRVWHKVGEKRGEVLVLTGDALHRIEVKGDKAKQEVPALAASLGGGQDPSGMGGAHVVPLASIRRVEVAPGNTSVKFVHEHGGKPGLLEFSVAQDAHAQEIARAAVERAGLPAQERSEDVTVVEALMPPVILGAIVGVVWGLVYMAAVGIEEGDDAEVHGRRRGIKMLFLFAAQLLGKTGTLVVGAVVLALFVYWAVMRIVKRPQRLVWGAPTA
jgi:hypothetical protein